MRSKRLAVASLFCVVVVFGALAANGEQYGVTANVPFDFMAGDTPLPAGAYNITRGSFNVPALSIKGLHSGVTMLSNVSGKRRDRTTCLVFNRYGDKYFLASIWSAEVGIEYTFFKSQREQEMVAKGTSHTVELIAANTR